MGKKELTPRQLKRGMAITIQRHSGDFIHQLSAYRITKVIKSLWTITVYAEPLYLTEYDGTPFEAPCLCGKQSCIQTIYSFPELDTEYETNPVKKEVLFQYTRKTGTWWSNHLYSDGNEVVVLGKAHIAESHTAMDKHYDAQSQASIASIREEEFWHATFIEGWQEKVTSAKRENYTSLMIHAGSYEAALERINSHTFREKDSEYANSGTFQLHRLRVKPEAKISPNIVWDLGMRWTEWHSPLTHVGYDVFAYKNIAEDIGSVSLYMWADMFDVIESETLPLDRVEIDGFFKNRNRNASLGHQKRLMSV